MINLTKKQGRLLLGILVLAALFFFLFRLGANAFLDYDEATYAQVTKEAIQNNEYFSFTLWGGRWIDKPPFYFWLAVGSAKVFGFNEMALRLPGAIMGILAVLLTWLLTLHLTKDYWTSFLAGAILLLCGEFAFAGRQIRLDVPVATAILASVYFFIRGWKNSKWFSAMGACLAIGVLTKSIVGFFAAPAMLGFGLAYKKWSYLKSGWFWGGLVLSLALLAPWLIIESQKYGGDFWTIYVGHHLLERVKAPVQGGSINVGHYIKYLFYLVEPWMAIFTGLAVWQVFKNGKKRDNYDPLILGSLLAFVFIFLIFAVSQTKLFYYLEPIYPFMAIFIAGSLVEVTREIKMARRNIFGLVSILLFFGLCNTIWQVINLRENFSNEYGVANEERTVGKILAANPAIPANTLDWGWMESLNFYSGRRIGQLAGAEINEAPQYIITLPEIFKFYKPSKVFRLRAELIYDSADISLYKVRSGEKTKIIEE